jgi:hypothetical protein
MQARGVTGTQLDILAKQTVDFTIRNKYYYMTFVHTFVVSPLKPCSSGILGMDFLQPVRAEISLTTHSFIIDCHSFPLTDWKSAISTNQRLANEGRERLVFHSQDKGSDECVEDWTGTVELAGTVMVPPHSVTIARCRVVRRGDSTDIKVLRKQVVTVDPEGLPRIYMARIVATLEMCVIN